MAAAQAGQVLHRFYRPLRRAQVREHRKGADRHRAVGHQVEEHRIGTAAEGLVGIGDRQIARHCQADQHVAGVGHARISQQAFEIVLEKSQHIAEDHGHGRQNPEQGRHLQAEGQTGRLALQPHEPEEADQGHEPGSLGHERQKRCYRRRRALVNVRRVEVERHGRNLEAQSRDHHQQRDLGDAGQCR